ncbi:hypothetical protein EA458_04065 [Streptococcus dysgalactiae subsp. dysgalactiae]|nr:hypothetical protein EA458_04065 [Streptococcus dysgalactiae subsp. dysgalactiae]
MLPSVLPKSSIIKNNNFEESRLFLQSEPPLKSFSLVVNLFFNGCFMVNHALKGVFQNKNNKKRQ